jgi:glycosyltransferase involved in cell wall biosynthesis
MALPPVFLHSLFRTGSTYIWNKFRQNRHYYCYYEPFHQGLAEITAENIEALLTRDFESVNHPPLDKYYLYEYKPLLDHRHEGLPFFKKSFSFDEFCFRDSENPDLVKYIDYLLVGAGKKIPVLQFNRSSLRVRWFKKYYPGARHIYLVRNPADQWSSYFEVTRKAKESIFLVMDLLIASINSGDGDFQPLSALLPLIRYHHEKLTNELTIYRLIEPSYSLEEKYTIFYYIWLKSLLENVFYADFILDINRLSDDTQYRKTFEDYICQPGEAAVDFRDAAVRTYNELPLDKEIMTAIETDIQQVIFSTLAQKQKQQLIDKIEKEGDKYLRLHPFGSIAIDALKKIPTQPGANRDQGNDSKKMALSLVNLHSNLEMKWKATRENIAKHKEMIRHLEDQLVLFKVQLSQSQQKEREMEQQLRESRRDLERILSSLSWRLTSPLRWIDHCVKAVSLPKNEEPGNKIKIAIDVTPVLPGGDNGGIKMLLWELLKRFAQREKEEYILLTTGQNHHLFDDFHLKRICVLNNSSVKTGFPKPKLITRVKQGLKKKRRKGLLRENGISVLFCPFAAPTFGEAGTAAVSVIADLQHLYYPFFFSKQELKNRNRFYEQLKARVSYVIAISDYTRKTVIDKLNFPPENVFTIPIALQDQHRDPSAAVRQRVREKFAFLNKKYCLYPANFWPHKNHKMLITAFAMYQHRYPAYDLHLVFTGEKIGNHGILADSIRQMGIEKKIHFTGFLPGDEIAVIWEHAYFLIYPSLFEGFGIPLVEAMRYNKPILASHVTSIPEVAGDAALYFDPKKPEQIVDALRSILEDKSLYKQLVERGQQQLKQYNPSEMEDRYLAVLHQAVRTDQNLQS